MVKHKLPFFSMPEKKEVDEPNYSMKVEYLPARHKTYKTIKRQIKEDLKDKLQEQNPALIT
jgi:hypothetical protein